MTVSQIQTSIHSINIVSRIRAEKARYRESFRSLLAGDLDFRGQDSRYASHNYHAFPAKFPPQLPRKFIEALTARGDVVLDPMAGSGTTIVEAFLAGRDSIGVDIDPLALRLCQTKTTYLPVEEVKRVGETVIEQALHDLDYQKQKLQRELENRYGEAEMKFIDYWFLPRTQLELMALLQHIEQIPSPDIRAFLELVFSGTIITKSGGVSMARDLAHTRPHRIEDKVPRSALGEFRKRMIKNLESLSALPPAKCITRLFRGNAQNLPLPNNTVDLIVTSPPYASNAIDYMRAHKFSLVWLGFSIAALSELRSEYIGHDAVSGYTLIDLPPHTWQVVQSVAKVDSKKANTLHRYYSEMTHCLVEITRVLKPGKAAVVVVGSSTMRGVDTQTDVCLGEIGKQAGLELVHIGAREIDRDKRMMPARRNAPKQTQIEERMHHEYVIGYLKKG
jgi:DNA modification methylase